MITFGPVPSRRLGRSLGINNVPPKTCTYSCIYCQVGPKPDKHMRPRPFFSLEEICEAVESHIESVSAAGETIDYLTFVPDGEPTLDANLGPAIRALRGFGIRIAVISNGSLAWREEVREALAEADWVSLKVDTVHEPTWRRINRPHTSLRLDVVLDGLRAFSRGYEGVLTSESMLVGGVNSDDARAGEIADFLRELQPARAYVSIPIRPPAVGEVRPPDEDELNRACQIISRSGIDVEYLTGYEGNAFSSTGDPQRDLLAITAVHPLREDAVQELLARTGSEWGAVQALLDEGRLRECHYQGRTFFVRSYPRVAEAAGTG
jgi:wyosine [tRNA(Phe)-imidazoG37] synthetase (radical SAM superfamily)